MNTSNPRIDSINAELKTLWNEYTSITDNVKNKLQEFITSWLGDDIKVVSLNETRFSFGFAADTWKDGSPKYTEIEIYHGYDYFNKDNYKFEINPFTGGSFSILAQDNDSNNDFRLRRYFELNGKIISDIENATALRNILKEYCDSVVSITNKRYDLNAEAHKIEADEREAQRKAEEQRKQNELLEKYNKTEYGWALIMKGSKTQNNYIYRKAPVCLVDIFTDEADAYRELRNHNRYHINGIKYVLIDRSKLKKV